MQEVVGVAIPSPTVDAPQDRLKLVQEYVHNHCLYSDRRSVFHHVLSSQVPYCLFRFCFVNWEVASAVLLMSFLCRLCGLRQENKKLVMKLRFLSSNIPSKCMCNYLLHDWFIALYIIVNPRVGVVNSPEIAGYHKLIEDLETKNKKLK